MRTCALLWGVIQVSAQWGISVLMSFSFVCCIIGIILRQRQAVHGSVEHTCMKRKGRYLPPWETCTLPKSCSFCNENVLESCPGETCFNPEPFTFCSEDMAKTSSSETFSRHGAPPFWNDESLSCGYIIIQPKALFGIFKLIRYKNLLPCKLGN